MRRKKIELLNKRETEAIGKSFMQNQIKSRKYSSAHQLHNKISENFDIKHLQRSKTDLSKETIKNASKKRYSTSFRSSHPKALCKKGVLKNFASWLFAYYWNRHQVVDKNLSKSVKILISEKTVLFSIFYILWKSFVFCRSINKNVLEWFLLLIKYMHCIHTDQIYKPF